MQYLIYRKPLAPQIRRAPDSVFRELGRLPRPSRGILDSSSVATCKNNFEGLKGSNPTSRPVIA